MKAQPACIPCYYRQALSSAEFVTADKKRQVALLNELANLVPTLDLDASPAHNSTIVLKAVNKFLLVNDPYKEEKRRYNNIALKMFSHLREIASNSPSRLITSARLAVVGNVIDLGIKTEINIDETLKKVLQAGFTIDHTNKLIEFIRNKPKILYLVDNSGEIVFDRIFIEELIREGAEVTVGVKSGPILNDCTLEDAVQIGLTEIVKVVETGSDWVGTHLDTCSPEFMKIFHESDLVISKGQGNFETLDGARKKIFFILKAKCESVASEFGVKKGDLLFVLKENS